MKTHIAFAALLIAGSSSLAAAQSSTATSGTTPPMKTAPTSSGTQPIGQQKAKIPPAASSHEKGLPGVMSDEPMEIKRNK